MKSRGLKKRISFDVPLSDWVRIRNKALREGIHISEIIRRWIAPEVNRLPAHDGDSQDVRAA